MAKVVPGTEVNLPEVPEVRISEEKRWPGKILAVRHPVFGWMSYKAWGMWKLVPEKRIVPAIIGGLAAYGTVRLLMDISGKVLDASQTFLDEILTPGNPLGFLFPGGFLIQGFKFFLPGIPGIDPSSVVGSAEDALLHSPLPYYAALLTAAFILAGADPGDLLIAIVNFIDSIVPL